MSTNKFLKNVVAYGLNQEVNKMMTGRKITLSPDEYASTIHADPITHLAVIFSALIHDVDHRGVSNVSVGFGI